MEQVIFTDKTIICQECKLAFIWEAHDQLFYYSKRLLPPKRCPTCRAIRKATIVLEDGGRR